MSDRNPLAPYPRRDPPEQDTLHPRSADAEYEPNPTMWVGWIAFASIVMVLLGTFHAFQGLVAILDEGYYQVPSDELLVHVDYSTWGWIHLVAGIVLACAGGALLAGHMWARIIAVLFLFVSAILNVAFLSAYPLWSTMMIVLDLLVLWAVVVHGRELRRPAESGY